MKPGVRGLVTGVYGNDNVSWEVHQARMADRDRIYRENPERFNAPERLAAKLEMLRRHQDGAVYQDGENVLWIGYEKNGEVRTFARVDFGERVVLFTPLVVDRRVLSKWAPLSQVLEQIESFEKEAPEGCI